MARDFQINGETLVKVKGSSSNPFLASLAELGLASEEIRVIPRWVHADMKTNSFGPEIPPDMQWLLAEVTIRMVLIHYDLDVLLACFQEAMCGGTEGVMQATGTPLGGGWPVFNANCHYISLNLLSPVLNKPWHFRAATLVNPTPEWPMGTKPTMVPLTWRAIPYVEGIVNNANSLTVDAEITPTGVPLWDHEIDS